MALCADRLFLAAVREPLSVSAIIILIIQTHSVIDLLIQSVYCLNKLYSSYPFKGFGAIGKPSNNHALTVTKTPGGQHTYTHTYVHVSSCGNLFESTCYPSNHMKNGHQGLSFTESPQKGITVRAWWRTVAQIRRAPQTKHLLWTWNISLHSHISAAGRMSVFRNC